MDMWVGIDLGQLVDPTALSVMARSIAIDPVYGRPYSTSRGDRLHRWDLAALKRYPLGTPYSTMVQDVVRIVDRNDLQPYPRLVIDGTGVGVAVVEMFRTALASHPSAEVHSICITSGRGFSPVGRHAWNVAKIEIVGALREVLESGRIKIARTPSGEPIEFSDILKRELRDFRVKITAAANETFAAREGAHDDLVLATALPIWLGAQRWCQMSERLSAYQEAETRRPREIKALDTERAAIACAEAEALIREREEGDLQTARTRDRQTRLSREFDHGCLSDCFADYLFDNQDRPPIIYFIVKTDDPELLDLNLRNWCASEVYRNMAGKPVQRRGGFLVECFGIPEVSGQVIREKGFGEILASLNSLDEA
jgi:hypothetical protein